MNVATPFADYFALIGRPFPDILSILGLSERLQAIERTFRTASMNNIHLATFYPGVEETLNELAARGLKLGIVTSKDRLRTGAILAKLPVDFTTVQTPNGRWRGKPAPDQLLVATAEANTDPAQAIYVGDMDADHEAARRAGIEYVHAEWGYGTTPPDCLVLGSIWDLLELRGPS